jgi:pimeloyl-ACP methyl ester carboxylesterase
MKTVTFADAALCFEDRGEGDPILFIHGFPLDHSMWRHQIEHFSATHRILAPDLRGFGGSTASTGVVTMAQFADDMAGLLDAIGETRKVVVCGLSMGGCIALQFAERHPLRLRGLILCDARAAADSPEAAAGREATADRVLKEGVGFLPPTYIPRLFSGKTQQERPSVVEDITRVIAGANAVGVAAAGRGLGRRSDMNWFLPTIPCPVLSIVGAEDVISTPEEMRAYTTTIPNSRFVEIPDVGHMSPLESPEAVNDAIGAFLQSLPV